MLHDVKEEKEKKKLSHLQKLYFVNDFPSRRRLTASASNFPRNLISIKQLQHFSRLMISFSCVEFQIF